MASNDQNFGGQNPPSCQGFGNPQNTDSLQDSQVQGLDNIQNPGNTQALRPSQIYGTQYTRFSRDELRSYDQMRRQTYPNTYNEEYPTDQVESDKLAYDEHTKNANSSMNKYWKEFKRNTRSEERDAKLEDLHPIHHSNLVSPAAQAAIDTSRYVEVHQILTKTRNCHRD